MLTRREESLLRSLRTRRNRDATGYFLVEGVRAVEELLESPVAVRFVVAVSSFEDDDRAPALHAAAEDRGIPWRAVAEAVFRGVAETETPQGVLAVAEIPQHRLASLPAALAPAVLLVLDAVQDPGNFGTLVRTAEALGVFAVVSLPGTVDAWNPKAVRAAMGASFRIPLVATAWDELAPWLRERGTTTLAAAAGAPPLDAGFGSPVALVVGNEGAGISGETRIHADRLVGIPLRGRAESLNVAAAAAILLHELLR